MSSTEHRSIEALVRRHGRELAAAAYLVLDNRAAAEQSAAAGIADVLRRRPGPVSADDPEVRDMMVAATLRRALETHRDLREIDPIAGVDGRVSFAGLSPMQRAVAAGQLFASVSTELLAAELSEPIGRVATARSTAASRYGGGEALADRLTAHQAGIALSVSATAVEQAVSAPPARRRRPFVAPAGVALALALVGVAIGLRLWLPANGEPSEAAASGRASSVPIAAALPIDEDLSLGDCNIQPASTELSFRGWLPLQDLVSTADPNVAAQPVYALVTRTTAEWVGWQTGEGRPMFPRPVGRLGCAIDPAGATTTVYAIPDSWQPPEMVDGCPSSPVTRYGPNLEVGGPHAFVQLPIAGRSWWSRDPGVEINVRIAPSPSAGAQVRAMARPLGAGEAIEFEVEGLSIRPDRPATSNHYVTLSGAAFPTAGCWSVSVAVEDEVVGSAVLPVTASVALRPAD